MPKTVVIDLEREAAKALKNQNGIELGMFRLTTLKVLDNLLTHIHGVEVLPVARSAPVHLRSAGWALGGFWFSIVFYTFLQVPAKHHGSFATGGDSGLVQARPRDNNSVFIIHIMSTI